MFGQRTRLCWDLPVREPFTVLGGIQGVGEGEHRARLMEFDALLESPSFRDTRVRRPCLGRRVRCDPASDLPHDPPVVFLDEPTIGMDVVARLAGRGLMSHGRIVLEGSLDEIRRRFGGAWQVRVTLTEPGLPVAPLPGTGLLLRKGPRLVYLQGAEPAEPALRSG
ncbi:hypothetical protein ABT063_30800 [Streptomyces sp. NPDC002838]|uniref:hypothetical protein n=1 Tax=Streptomyces sp. NPDC002838 TaxID=3154436 RepID=UPI00333241CF